MHIIEKRSAESSTSYIGGSDVKIAIVHWHGKGPIVKQARLDQYLQSLLFGASVKALKNAIYHHIADSTHIAEVSLKKLISHSKTKAELKTFLAQKVMERGEAIGKQVIVALATELCKATHKDVSH